MKPQIGGQDATFIFVSLSLLSFSLGPNFDCTRLAMLKPKDWIVSELSPLSTIVKSKQIFLSAVSISGFEVFLSFTTWHSSPGEISEPKSSADNSKMIGTALVDSKLKYLAHFQTLPAFDNGFKWLDEEWRKKNPPVTIYIVTFMPNQKYTVRLCQESHQQCFFMILPSC